MFEEDEIKIVKEKVANTPKINNYIDDMLNEINIKQQLKEFSNSMENIDKKEIKQFMEERINISNDIDKLIKKYGEDKITVIIQQLLDKLDTILKIKNNKIENVINSLGGKFDGLTYKQLQKILNRLLEDKND